MTITKAALKKQLHNMGIKTYRNKVTGTSYIKKSDATKVLARIKYMDIGEHWFSLKPEYEMMRNSWTLTSDKVFIDHGGNIRATFPQDKGDAKGLFEKLDDMDEADQLDVDWKWKLPDGDVMNGKGRFTYPEGELALDLSRGEVKKLENQYKFD